MRFPTLSLVIRQSIGAWAKPNSLRLAYTISKVGCGLTVAARSATERLERQREHFLSDRRGGRRPLTIARATRQSLEVSNARRREMAAEAWLEPAADPHPFPNEKQETRNNPAFSIPLPPDCRIGGPQRRAAQPAARGQAARGYLARLRLPAHHRGLVLGTPRILRVRGRLLLATPLRQLVPERRRPLHLPRHPQPGLRSLERQPHRQLHRRARRQLRPRRRHPGARQEQEGPKGHRRLLERYRQPHGPAHLRPLPGALPLRRDLRPLLRQRVQR